MTRTLPAHAIRTILSHLDRAVAKLTQEESEHASVRALQREHATGWITEARNELMRYAVVDLEVGG